MNRTSLLVSCRIRAGIIHLTTELPTRVLVRMPREGAFTGLVGHEEGFSSLRVLL